MRACAVLMLVAGVVAGQTSASGPALVRGVLLERDQPNPSGEFSVRALDNQVFRYRFDAKTYVERDDQLIDVRRLQPGDKVEVVSDEVPGSVLRYARTVHVLADRPPHPTLTARPRAGRPSYAMERILPTGNLTYSGVVFRVTGDSLVIHTRSGDESLLIRKDTRFIRNGEIVEAGDLKPNMRVFVRAGKDLWDQLEAYQVIWGRILDPK
jgi:hypothetical protein